MVAIARTQVFKCGNHNLSLQQKTQMREWDVALLPKWMSDQIVHEATAAKQQSNRSVSVAHYQRLTD